MVAAITSVQATDSPAIPEAWWDDFDPPPGHRAEIVRGEIIVTPSPGLPHAQAATELVLALQRDLPEELTVVQAVEWRLPKGGIVASAPVPDILVVSRGLKVLAGPPLLAVEILSPSDNAGLAGGGTRIEGKRLDYAANGLQHYLEVFLAAQGGPQVVRYELQDRPVRARGSASVTQTQRLVQVAEAYDDELLAAVEPFPYEIRPSALSS